MDVLETWRGLQPIACPCGCQYSETYRNAWKDAFGTVQQVNVFCMALPAELNMAIAIDKELKPRGEAYEFGFLIHNKFHLALCRSEYGFPRWVPIRITSGGVNKFDSISILD